MIISYEPAAPDSHPRLLPPRSVVMDVGQVYAIAIGGIFCILLLINGRPWIARLFRYLSPLISKHLIYRYILHRHRFLGPWSRAYLLAQLIYTAGNICCFKFWDTTISQAGLQAGTLAMINLIPLFGCPHFSTLADLLGLTLSMFRQIHRSAGVMAVMLTIFHVLVMVASQPSFSLDLPQNLFAVIGASSLGVIILLSLSLFRRPSYELFLRTHQVLAALAAYSIWRHLPSKKAFPRVYLYISAGLFLSMCIFQGYMFIRRNGAFRHRRARAQITHEYGAVRVRIQLQKPLEVKAGQAINLWMWMPSVNFWSFLQSHPFVVISWAEKPQDHLDLFIEPRRGLTRELLYYAKSGHIMSPWVLFSGPHGKSIPMDDCENILMVASGFGIAAQLPYLKQLIHGYNARKLRARRVHLVWQVEDIDVTIAAQSLLNGALNEDTLDDGWILAISIYCESNNIPNKSFGKRANAYPGKAPLGRIFKAELAGEQMEKMPVKNVDWDTNVFVEGKELESKKPVTRDGKMLVTVSATNDVRDDLRSIVRDYLTDEVSFFELDYQPLQK